MFLGFVLAVRAEAIASELGRILPDAWGKTLLPAPTYSDRRNHHLPRLDVDALRQMLRSRAPLVRAAVILAVDFRPGDIEALRKDLVYSLPRVEVLEVRSKELASLVPYWAEYYGLVPSTRPADLSDALSMFLARFPTVTPLDRAKESAVEAFAFREPRLALYSLHFLPRIYVEWADARRRDPGRSNHADLRELRYPARDAFREVLQDAQFDVSDSLAKGLNWECPDEVRRYFGWHLKWSLGAQRTIENHCRIHYAIETGDEQTSSRVFLGHCGKHL